MFEKRPDVRTAPADDNEAAFGRRLAGKYMAFKLGAEEYGLEILKVRELIGAVPTTYIAGAPSFISGVINLRGRVIPVMELRRKFGMPSVPVTEQSVIIVIEYRSGSAVLVMGILVDEVVEVISLSPDQIQAPPDFGVHSDATAHILALGKADARVICLLDISNVLSACDHAALGEALKST